VPLRDLHDYVDRTFRHMAESTKLNLSIDVAPDVPRSINTDAKRLQQILKNLLSNAFKFTDRGGVTMDMRTVTEGWNTENQSLNRAKSVVAFSVHDTGIGIPAEKQQIIFEAFQQADGSTSRKYGGTGLGLAISREIAGLLGGEIKLASTPNQGSTFTLFLPQSYAAPKSIRRQLGNDGVVSNTVIMPAEREAPAPSRGKAQQQPYALEAMPSDLVVTTESEVAPPADGEPNPFADDSGNIGMDDRVLLIVENDPNFVSVLIELAHENNFKALVAPRGATALHAARERRPDAITLDINLPDIDGWRILSRLKDDDVTRHIPVQVITTDEEAERALRLGAMGALIKPVKTKAVLDETFRRLRDCLTPRTRSLLLIEADEARRQQTAELIGGDDVEVAHADSAEAALAACAERRFDVVVTSLDVAGRKAVDLVDEIRESAPAIRDVPMIVYSERELSKKEETQLKRLTQTTVLKDVRSPQRLLDEVSMFLHRRLEAMPEDKRRMLEQLHRADTILAGKKVLIVDDDIRNIFAMTSILEPHRMDLRSAETGREAIEALQNEPEIDVVLMDIMMPDMDGYDTMRTIRKLGKFRSLPIIALTAKAMKGDREKCIEAGASDYISKPVDTEQLLAMLRVWLYR
jgi:CheY-like chemotaxis protein